MKQCKHREMNNNCSADCDGTVKRNGWAYESIDAGTWACPAWKCDKCGAKFWSWFDVDNGDEAYDIDNPEGEE